jgi:hypothetical protein
MIIIKGERVVFVMKDGKIKRPPASYGIIHDPDGKQLPICTVFIGPVKRTQQPAASYGKAKSYFGSKHILKQASINRPPSSWSEVGEVVEIRYVRKGKYAGGYFHPFKSFSPVLSKSGRWYKLELRSGCIVDDRGFVFP